MNFTQSLRWRHEYVVEALWIRKQLCSGCDAKLFMVQCCAVSLERSPLLCFLKGHRIYFFYVVHINLFLQSEIQEASPLQLLVLRAEMFLYCLVQIPMV